MVVHVPNLATCDEVASLLACNPETVRVAARTGRGIAGVKAVKVGGRWLWDLDRISAALSGAPS